MKRSVLSIVLAGIWITFYNLQVLPLRLLVFAVPLSLLEIVIAELIINKIVKGEAPVAVG
jgi:hypothetical protein